MYEIIILIVALAMMAKHGRRPRRRWNPNNQVVQVLEALSLATLGNATALPGEVVPAADGEYLAITMKGTWALRDGTAAEGPITVGFSHGDYTATEIGEWLASSTAMSRGDKIANERAKRLIRRVGVFSGSGTDETLNDGKPITTRLGWAIPEGTVINLWAFNQSGAALTTGTEVVFNGQVFLRWT